LLSAFSASAQRFIGEDDERSLDHPLHFGVTFGVNISDYKIIIDSQYYAQTAIRTIRSSSSPGFNLGVISDFAISRSFDFRFVPDLSFTERDIVYSLQNVDTLATKQVQSVYLDFPVELKYKSAPYKDFRMYVVGGVRYSLDLASNAEARNAESLVKVYPNSFFAEYGVGCEFHLPLVTICPEIKVSYGLTNALKQDPALPYSNVISKLIPRSILISLHFEG
jgi:hypothetical protein